MNSNEKCELTDLVKPFEIVIVVFKHTLDNGIDSRISIAQTALRFTNTAEILDWADGAGLDFS